jgi:hypothetical protein
MKMCNDIQISTTARRGVACNAPNAVTAMVGHHTRNRRGRPACLPLCNDVCPTCGDICPICNDVCLICGVSLRQGVAGNAPTSCCDLVMVVRRHGSGQTSPQMGRHAGLPLHFRNPNVGATLAQQARKGRPYGADTTTGDIP